MREGPYVLRVHCCTWCLVSLGHQERRSVPAFISTIFSKCPTDVDIMSRVSGELPGRGAGAGLAEAEIDIRQFPH